MHRLRLSKCKWLVKATEQAKRTMQTLSKRAKPKFRFLDLPAEIRNAVYEYAFDADNPGYYSAMDHYPETYDEEFSYCYHHNRAPFHALFWTSRQVRQESMSLYYSTGFSLRLGDEQKCRSALRLLKLWSDETIHSLRRFCVYRSYHCGVEIQIGKDEDGLVQFVVKGASAYRSSRRDVAGWESWQKWEAQHCVQRDTGVGHGRRDHFTRRELRHLGARCYRSH